MIKINSVSKRIKNKQILCNISYEFQKSTIYGLYGPNGSGKTMVLRLISGLIIPTEGTVEIDGEILHQDISFPRSVGVIIENMKLLPYLNAYDNLFELAKIKKIASKEDILKSLKRVGLETDILVKKYSLGMCQRLNIAQAILETPELIILDEPTNALDENGRALIYKILKEEKERGATIIMATHNREDLLNVCDVTLKIIDGKLEEYDR